MKILLLEGNYSKKKVDFVHSVGTLTVQTSSNNQPDLFQRSLNGQNFTCGEPSQYNKCFSYLSETRYPEIFRNL